MSDESPTVSTSDIILAEAKRLAPLMMSRLSEPVDASIEQIAEKQQVSRDEVSVELWDALLGEIYNRLSLVP